MLRKVAAAAAAARTETVSEKKKKKKTQTEEKAEGEKKAARRGAEDSEKNTPAFQWARNHELDGVECGPVQRTLPPAGESSQWNTKKLWERMSELRARWKRERKTEACAKAIRLVISLRPFFLDWEEDKFNGKKGEGDFNIYIAIPVVDTTAAGSDGSYAPVTYVTTAACSLSGADYWTKYWRRLVALLWHDGDDWNLLRDSFRRITVGSGLELPLEEGEHCNIGEGAADLLRRYQEWECMADVSFFLEIGVSLDRLLQGT